MISFEPRVGIVLSGLTSGGFTVIIPYFNFKFALKPATFFGFSTFRGFRDKDSIRKLIYVLGPCANLALYIDIIHTTQGVAHEKIM